VGEAETLPSRGLTRAIVYRPNLEAVGTKSCSGTYIAAVP